MFVYMYIYIYKRDHYQDPQPPNSLSLFGLLLRHSLEMYSNGHGPSQKLPNQSTQDEDLAAAAAAAAAFLFFPPVGSDVLISSESTETQPFAAHRPPAFAGKVCRMSSARRPPFGRRRMPAISDCSVPAIEKFRGFWTKQPSLVLPPHLNNANITTVAKVMCHSLGIKRTPWPPPLPSLHLTLSC